MVLELPTHNRQVTGSNPVCPIFYQYGGMADTADLKSASRKGVRVRIPLLILFKTIINMRHKKEDYNNASRRKLSAMMKIARDLGEDHPLTKMMGSLAWGRHKAEQGPTRNLQTAIIEMAYIDGYFEALNMWARDNDSAAQRTILNIYPLGFREYPNN